ncbi:MAG: DUF484 family protein [Leucothrix sp.]
MTKIAESMLTTAPDDLAICDYLKARPDFLVRYPELLEQLEVQQGITGATSLLERQTKVLRGKNKHLEDQLDNLIMAARNNEQIMKRLQHLTLELLRSDNLDMLLSTCQDVLRGDFNADFVSFRLFQDKPQGRDMPGLHYVKSNHTMVRAFDALFSDLKPVCGPCPEEQLNFLFRENGSRIKSVALIPLQCNHSIGLLALGSVDAERFHKGMGIVFISHLGELIATAISKYVE